MSRELYQPNRNDLLASGADQERLHSLAWEQTRRRFGSNVFLRAVVEISNFCRENCSYCGMRRDNRELARYRARLDQLEELLLAHRPASITDINLQAGEDPVAVREVAIPLIRKLRRETPLGVSVCLGTLTESTYDELLNAGASLYIMKFESADPQRYQQLQAPGTLPERLKHIRTLSARGWKVSSGFIAGLPEQGPEDLLNAIRLAGELPLVGCSVSPFIPGEATPLATAVAGSIDQTLNSMASLRLMKPELVIPSVSALNLAEPDRGYRRGLRTGANLVTINLTPSEIRGNYLLYKKDRFIMTEERILEAIAAEGLQPSRQSLVSYLTSSDRPTERVELAK